MATKRTRSKVKRVKRVKRSLKRRSFKNTKRTKRTKITKRKKTKRKRRTQINRRNKRMSGGMDASVNVDETLESVCYTVGNTTGKWNKRFAVLYSDSLMIYLDETKQGGRSDSVPSLRETYKAGPPLNIDQAIWTTSIKRYPMGKDYYLFRFNRKDYIFEERDTRDQFVTGIKNILEERDWNISEADVMATPEKAKVAVAEVKRVEEIARAEAKRVEEIARAEAKRVEEIARAAAQTEENKNEELRAIAKYDIFGLIQKNGITDPLEKFKYTMEEFRKFLSELLSVNIKSIEGFRSGSFGLIVIVIVDGLRKVFKITLEHPRETSPCNNEKIEFDIQSKVTEIQEDITIGVDSFTCVTGITPIVGMRQLIMAISEQSEDIENKIQTLGEKRLRIPTEWTWSGWSEKYSEDICFSIIIMDYLEGINLSTFLKSSTDKDKVKEVLEDFRKKINLLHNRGIYHCDLHSGNVMVRNSDNTIRIIDFGQSTLVESSDNPEWDETKNCGARHIVQEDSERMAQVLVQKHCPGPWGEEKPTCLD